MTDAAATSATGLDRRRVVRVVLQVLALLLGVHLLLPQLAGLERTAEQLARATWWLAPAVIALEAVSLLAYGEVVRTNLLRGGADVRRSLVQRCVLVGNGLGRALPAGSAASFAVTVGTFRRAGADGVRAAESVAGAGLLSSATLAALLPVGVVLSLLTARPSGVVVTATIAAGAILLGVALLPAATRDPAALGARVEGLLGRSVPRPLRRRVDPAALGAAAERGATGVRELASDRRVLAPATGWALANWLLDVAVVVVIAMTIGAGTPLPAILLAYVVAMLVAGLPLTPGGVGLVEPAMIGILVSAGAPVAAATVTVLGWRLVSHWLPVLVGLALLPGLQVRTGRDPSARS